MPPDIFLKETDVGSRIIMEAQLFSCALLVLLMGSCLPFAPGNRFLVQAELIQSSSGRICLANMAKFCKSLLIFLFVCLFVQGHVYVSVRVHTCTSYFFNIYFIIYLLGYARSQVKHVVSSSMTRGATRAPYIGSLETQPLDHYGSPSISLC